MQFLNINKISRGIIAVIVIAATTFMVVVPLLDQPAVTDQSAAAPKPVPPQPRFADPVAAAFQDFAERMALDQRLRRLEQQIQTLLNTAPTIVPQQAPIAHPPVDRVALLQRLRTLEQQTQTLLNTRERAVQTGTVTFPKSWVRRKQTTTKYRHRRRHEIDGTALAGETVDANPAARRGTAPTATREPEYDEAGAQIK